MKNLIWEKFWRHLILGIFIAGINILIFAKLAEDLLYNELTVFDQIVTCFVMNFTSPQVTKAMIMITTCGSLVVFLPITVITIYLLYSRRKHYWESIMVITALSGGWLLDDFLKWVFHRSRPGLTRLVEASGYSFPSGHAMVSAAFYGFLAYLLWENLQNNIFRYTAAAAIVVLIIFIGVSRIYLGVHYPSDVLAGFASGCFWLSGCILATQTIRYYKSNKQN